MSCDTDTVTLLRRSGHKVTPQRMQILQTLRHSEKRLSAYGILEIVKPSFPYIDISTVYRTLALLVRARHGNGPGSASAHHDRASAGWGRSGVMFDGSAEPS